MDVDPFPRQDRAMEILLLLGLVGQVLALRLLVIQLARSPDDPPLLRHSMTPLIRERRERRHQRLLRAAIGGFAVATVTTVLGLVAIVA
jgi:hypothetical protein